jgi:predicted GNAT superfamily acetyltransferase
VIINLHIPVALQQAFFLIINRPIRNDLVRFLASWWKDLSIDLLEFVMTVCVNNITRGPQPQIQAIISGDALLVSVDDAGNLFRERG